MANAPDHFRPGKIVSTTGELRAIKQVNRDLCVLTGPELLDAYGKVGTAAYRAFTRITGKEPAEVAATHNPFWFYVRMVWYGESYYRERLDDARHRDELSAAYLKLALGELDTYDAMHNQWPRRAFKSTFMTAFADWAPKRHRVVDGLDVLVMYSHNSEQQAQARGETIKEMARRNQFIKDTFPEFVIPSGEWGTKAEWDWPCRGKAGPTAAVEKSMTFLSMAGKKAGRGYHYRLLDDWEDEDAKDSEIVRATLSSRYQQQRKLKTMPFSREASCGTPYHTQSLYKPMLEARHTDGTPRYFVVKTPALDKDDRPNFPSNPQLSVEELAKERANEIRMNGNDRFWYLQYQLDPTLTGDQAMQWAWFTELSRANYKKNWQHLPHFRACFCDPAWKGEDNQGKGDDAAIAVIDIYQRGEFYDYVVLDGLNSNELVSDEGAAEMCRLMRKWGTPYYIIEQTADKPHVGTMRQVGRNQNPPMFPIYIDIKRWTDKSKASRISAVAGSARMGHWYYLDPADDLADPSYRRFIQDLQVQADEYPGSVKRDILDCLANAHSDDVIRKWVPVAISPAYQFNENERRNSIPMATPILPAILTH